MLKIDYNIFYSKNIIKNYIIQKIIFRKQNYKQLMTYKYIEINVFKTN